MQVQVVKESLKAALTKAKVSYNGKTTLPILSTFLLEAKDGKLVIKSTDLGTATIHAIPADHIAEEGIVCLDAVALITAVSSAPRKAMITIGVESAFAAKGYVEFSGATISVDVFPADEFPLIPQVVFESGLEVEAQELKAVLERVAPAAAKDSARPVLECIEVKFWAGLLNFQTTDGFRLAKDAIPYSGESTGNFLISAANGAKLAKAIGRYGGHCAIQEQEHNVSFYFGDSFSGTVFVIQKEEEGIPYPDTEYITTLPQNIVSIATVEASVLLDMCKRVPVVGKDNTVLLSMSDEGRLYLENFKGTITWSLYADAAVDGASVSAGFNLKYLLDMLSPLKDGVITMSIESENSPLYAVSDVSDRLLYVIMPMLKER